MKKLLAEFRAFALRGNVIDLAVGVIIGGAFQKIVTSVVNDLIMPWIGLITGGVNFVDQFVVLKMPEVLPEGVTEAMVESSKAVATEVGATTFNYGAFITAVIDFLIMAVIIFALVKIINRLSALGKKEEEPAPTPAPTTKVCPFCKSEIAIEATRCAHCTSELTE